MSYWTAQEDAVPWAPVSSERSEGTHSVVREGKEDALQPQASGRDPDKKLVSSSLQGACKGAYRCMRWGKPDLATSTACAGISGSMCQNRTYSGKECTHFQKQSRQANADCRQANERTWV